MSALTSMRINKGGAKFAPNIKARPAVKKPSVAVPASRRPSITTALSEASPTLGLPQTTDGEDRIADNLTITPLSSHPGVAQPSVPAPLQTTVASSNESFTENDQFTSSTAEVSMDDLQTVTTPVFTVDVPTQAASTTANLGNVICTPIAVPTSSAGTAIQIPISNATAGPSTNRRRSCSVLSSTESVSGDGDEAAAKRRKKGKGAAALVEILPTYEDYNESLRRDNSEVSMTEFCKLRNPRGGKPSRTWYDNEKKRLEENTLNEGDENRPVPEARNATPQPSAAVQKANPPIANTTAVQLRLDKNGNMIIDEESLIVDHAAIYDDGQPSEIMELVDESNSNRYVNSSTYSKKEKGERWTKEHTAQFYDAISKWGTDFEIISHLFPGRSRKSIKNKFKKEEKERPGLLKEALESRRPTTIAEYEKETGREYPLTIPKTAEEIAAEQEQERQLAEAAEAARIERQKEFASRAETDGGTGKNRRKGKSNGNQVAGGEEEVVGFLDNVPASQRTFADWT